MSAAPCPFLPVDAETPADLRALQTEWDAEALDEYDRHMADVALVGLLCAPAHGLFRLLVIGIASWLPILAAIAFWRAR